MYPLKCSIQHGMKKLLIIEDNYDIRENLVEFLELYGYEIIAVNNGKDGIEYAWKFIPDLIICDVVMPHLNGYEVLGSFSGYLYKHYIPFIFSSSKAEKKDYLEGMELGADDYIVKPFEPESLLIKIEACLQSACRAG